MLSLLALADVALIGVIVPRRFAGRLAAGVGAELRCRELLLDEWDRLAGATSLTCCGAARVRFGMRSGCSNCDGRTL